MALFVEAAVQNRAGNSGKFLSHPDLTSKLAHISTLAHYVLSVSDIVHPGWLLGLYLLHRSSKHVEQTDGGWINQGVFFLHLIGELTVP